MTGVGKIGKMVVQALVPKKLKPRFNFCVGKIKAAMTSTKSLKVFWKIVFFPLTFSLSLLLALFKSFLILILPQRTYVNHVYIFQQMFVDIAQRDIGFFTALKRASLRNELLTKGAQTQKSYGDKNPDLTFYVIRPYYFLQPNVLIYRNVANLLTQYYYVLQKLSYALENGYIPVVDWKNYGLMPHAENYPVNGTENSWEYYWTQPSSFTLEEVYQSKNVILSTQNIGDFGYIPHCSMAPPYDKYAHDLAEQCPPYLKNVHLNEITENYVSDAQKELFPEGKRIMGVVLRGAAYGHGGTPYRSHPQQVGMEELKKTIWELLDEWGMDLVFFVNEMQEMVDEMREEFGDRLIVLPRMRDTFERPTDGITKNPMYYDGNRYQTNLDYVTEIALLSRCDTLIGSMSSGMRTALIWNAQKYEHTYVFDKGLW